MEAGSNQCPSCGAARGGSSAAGVAGGKPAAKQWLVPGGILVVAVIFALFFVVRINGPQPQPVTPVSAGGGQATAGGLPPDISQMSPRERFDRLYNRVMQAAEQGDAATMQQFSPMALSAYEMLDPSEIDADARYHAALLKLHSGDMPGSVAEADAILEREPSHLFGLVVRATLAKWQQDDDALVLAYGQFLEYYDAEMALNRPEYGHHQTMLEGFRSEALAAQ